MNSGDPCFPDYTYATLIARLEESGAIWLRNIENNRKMWALRAEEDAKVAEIIEE